MESQKYIDEELKITEKEYKNLCKLSTGIFKSKNFKKSFKEAEKALDKILDKYIF